MTSSSEEVRAWGSHFDRRADEEARLLFGAFLRGCFILAARQEDSELFAPEPADNNFNVFTRQE